MRENKLNKNDQLRRNILANFIELIENKPGLKEDPDIREAYNDLKDDLYDLKKNPAITVIEEDDEDE